MRDTVKLATAVILVSSLIGFLSACEQGLKVYLDGKTPPTFTFSGSGDLLSVNVYEVTSDGKLPPKGSSFWVIVASKPIKNSAVPAIKYGVIPEGFVQEVPAVGNPPPLQEGKIYGLRGFNQEAPSGSIWFAIRNGQSIKVPKTDPAAKDVSEW